MDWIFTHTDGMLYPRQQAGTNGCSFNWILSRANSGVAWSWDVKAD
jgi:hypothetical protein